MTRHRWGLAWVLAIPSYLSRFHCQFPTSISLLWGLPTGGDKHYLYALSLLVLNSRSCRVKMTGLSGLTLAQALNPSLLAPCHQEPPNLTLPPARDSPCSLSTCFPYPTTLTTGTSLASLAFHPVIPPSHLFWLYLLPCPSQCLFSK